MTDIEVIDESASAKEAVPTHTSLRADIAICDARLLDGSGVDASRKVRSMDPIIKGLVLTSSDVDHALTTTAVLAGASGLFLEAVRSNGLVATLGMELRRRA